MLFGPSRAVDVHDPHHTGLRRARPKRGELLHGSRRAPAGGYGDPLERDPGGLVIKDYREDIIPTSGRQHSTARVYPTPETVLVLDKEARSKAARRERGRPAQARQAIQELRQEVPKTMPGKCAGRTIQYYGLLGRSPRKLRLVPRGGVLVRARSWRLSVGIQPIFNAHPKDVKIIAHRGEDLQGLEPKAGSRQ